MDVSQSCSPNLTNKLKTKKMQQPRRSVILTVHSKVKHPACVVNKNTVASFGLVAVVVEWARVQRCSTASTIQIKKMKCQVAAICGYSDWVGTANDIITHGLINQFKIFHVTAVSIHN